MKLSHGSQNYQNSTRLWNLRNHHDFKFKSKHNSPNLISIIFLSFLSSSFYYFLIFGRLYFFNLFDFIWKCQFILWGYNGGIYNFKSPNVPVDNKWLKCHWDMKSQKAPNCGIRYKASCCLILAWTRWWSPIYVLRLINLGREWCKLCSRMKTIKRS